MSALIWAIVYIILAVMSTISMKLAFFQSDYNGDEDVIAGGVMLGSLFLLNIAVIVGLIMGFIHDGVIVFELVGVVLATMIPVDIMRRIGNQLGLTPID